MEASLVYRVRSRTARATQRNPVSNPPPQIIIIKEKDKPEVSMLKSTENK